jgi:hypothetical protein
MSAKAIAISKDFDGLILKRRRETPKSDIFPINSFFLRVL